MTCGGTRFLLTEESAAHGEYKRRVMAAKETPNTMSLGLGRDPSLRTALVVLR